MCLKPTAVQMSQKKQRGFLIPLALVLLVGIAFLAIAVNRLSGQGGSSATVEGLSVQAFFAAESGAQLAMNQIFFNATTRTQTDTNCAGVNGRVENFGVNGLALCAATINCTQSVDAENTTSFYLINSAATCGAAGLIGQRTIQISATMQ